MSIFFNNSSINDWNLGDSNLIKVYRHNAICYYKVVAGETAQTPCYAVVNDITQYQDTEFENVFNKADNKWYKLNNLNEYEEYGVYGSGRTSCEGSASRLPQGYTEVEYIRNSNYNAYINTGVIPYDNTSNRFTVTARVSSEYHSNLACATIIACEEVNSPYYGFGYRYKCSAQQDVLEFFGGDGTVSKTSASTSGDTVTLTFDKTANSTKTMNVPLYIFGACENSSYTSATRYSDSALYSMTVVKNNETVRDFVPAKRDSDDKYGLYDLITDTFYTSPNGNNFIGGEPVTPTDCVTTYEGKLTVDDGYEYEWNGSSWVNVGEVSGGTASLPNVPFTVNYNAKNYNASTKTLAKTSGQLADTDAVVTAGTPTVGDGYLTIASGTIATISGYQTYFNRDSNNPNLTIVSKQLTNGSNCHIFANRDTVYNWMYRPTSTKLNFHGSSQIGGTTTTIQPVTESVRVDSNRTLTFNDYSNNTTSASSNFTYGSTNNGNVALFAGYGTSGSEWFVGDFYWIYMSQYTLTDEQIQQVISYNEGSSQVVYPMYYTEMQDPPNNVSFSSMTEAEEYECPYVGLMATINGDLYIFNDNYEWELIPRFEGKWKATYTGGTVSSASCDSSSAITENEISTANLVSVELGDCVTSISYNAFKDCNSLTSIDIPSGVTSIGNEAFRGCTSLSSITILDSVTSIGVFAFNYCTSLTSCTIGSGVTSIGNFAFANCSGLISCTIGSGVTSINSSAFYNCTSLTSITVEAATPPSLGSLTFNNTNNCPIYVPSQSVETYKATSGWSSYASRIQAIP